MVNDYVVTEEQGDALNLNANIYTLAKGDMQIFKAIKSRNESEQPIRSLAELAPLEVDDWKAILNDAQVEGDDDAIEKQARLKQKQIEILFTHQVFKARSSKSESPEVRGLMDKFYEVNEDLNFLDLDYNEGSEDLGKVDLDNFPESDKEAILGTLKTNQRLHSITKDAADTFRLKDAGYQSGFEIALDSYPNFLETTGLVDSPLVKMYFDTGGQIARNDGVALGNIADVKNNLFENSPTENMSNDVQSYLRRLNGYEEFFGETDYCKCEHCASIISPVAYFVDLMDFLEQRVMDPVKKRVGTVWEESILNPRVRRSDLWEGLILNCKNTHELIPYLKIINEVLENFIYTQYHELDDDTLPDRNTIENSVYELLSKRIVDGKIYSFRQPFHLPLVELETYLQHFPITRSSIANTLFAYIEDSNNILPQSALKLSKKEYDLILEDRSVNDEENRDRNQTFLRNLYKIDIDSDGSIDEIDVQELLLAMEVPRTELTSLTNTYFVTFGFNETVEVVGDPEPGNLQINKEYMVGITMGILDRMHRFVRLLRQLDWSIEELDKVIRHLHRSEFGSENFSQELFPEKIVKLVKIQNNLKVTTDELCLLIHRLPIEGPTSFFDQRFNLSAFIHEESDEWTWSDYGPDASGIRFQHPAHQPDASEPDNNILHRLLAGIGVNDEELFLLSV